MPIEKRTRVEIFLPLRSDLSSYEIVLKWLSEELAYARGGATLTSPFAGLYVSPTQFSVVEDAIRILFCDFELNCERSEDLEEITAFLEDFKSFMMKTLEEEEVWIVFYPISRIIS